MRQHGITRKTKNDKTYKYSPGSCWEGFASQERKLGLSRLDKRGSANGHFAVQCLVLVHNGLVCKHLFHTLAAIGSVNLWQIQDRLT